MQIEEKCWMWQEPKSLQVYQLAPSYVTDCACRSGCLLKSSLSFFTPLLEKSKVGLFRPACHITSHLLFFLSFFPLLSLSDRYWSPC